MASKKQIFTQLQKKYFVELLKSYSSIIESKRTDGSTLRAKKIAWDNITKQYNASLQATFEVTNKQLRRLWMNMKQRQRGALTKERQYRVATSGGPPTRTSAANKANVVKVAPALIVTIDGAIDSDTIPVSQIKTEEDETSRPASGLDNFTSTSQLSQSSQPLEPGLPIITYDLHPSTITTPPTRAVTTPPLTTIITPPSSTIITPPHPTVQTPITLSLPHSRPSTSSLQQLKISILEREYNERQRRADQLHEFEKEINIHRVREAKAKADLAELILQQQHSTGK